MVNYNKWNSAWPNLLYEGNLHNVSFEILKLPVSETTTACIAVCYEAKLQETPQLSYAAIILQSSYESRKALCVDSLSNYLECLRLMESFFFLHDSFALLAELYLHQKSIKRIIFLSISHSSCEKFR